MKNKMGNLEKEKEELLETISQLEIQITNLHSIKYEEDLNNHNSCFSKIRSLEEERDKLHIQISNTINKNNHTDTNPHHSHYNFRTDSNIIKIRKLEEENSKLESQIIYLNQEIEILKINDNNKGTDKMENIKKKKKKLKKKILELQEKTATIKKVTNIKKL